MTRTRDAETIIALTELLLDATIGHLSPYVKRIQEWMGAPPSPNDLIVETSSGRNPPEARIGRFIKYEEKNTCDHEMRTIPPDETCTACEDEERSMHRFTWTKSYDGLNRRWYDATFVRVPKNIAEMRALSTSLRSAPSVLIRSSEASVRITVDGRQLSSQFGALRSRHRRGADCACRGLLCYTKSAKRTTSAVMD